MEQLLAQLFASAAGEGIAAMSETQQQYLLQRAYEEYGKIDLPSLKAIIAEEVGPSAMEGVQSDPEMKGLERQALDEMLRVGRSGGATLEDKANLASVQGSIGQQEAAGRNNIRENMARRGQSGGGAELSMQLANQQGAANRASAEGLNVAAQSQARARDAILQGGRMAGGMRRDDFSEQSQRASAADARTRYNADARARANTYNAGLAQQQFGNEMARAGGRSGQLNGQADFYGGQAAGTRALSAGAGKSIYEAGKAYDEDDEEGGW